MSLASPCIGNCCLDSRDVCLGCFRHVDEIKAWSLSDDTERLKIVQAAQSRRKQQKQNSALEPTKPL
ncbi:MAG: DUF1289 domain-containing protein [Gammaproteobacteria bacterium HGW-Gammaproteobacteria-3]|nr:MAG: DUF1289 domain-containing protein [Gammaproteobacteria bacterium HGW-Gammaproteobacteria-3]